MPRTHYETLQIRADATEDEIKEAYRTLAWKAQTAGGQEALKEINAAYAILSSPSRRAEYDLSLTAPAPQSHPQPPTAEPATAAQPWHEPAPIEEDGPGFHPFLRLFGLLGEISQMVSGVRYLFLPMNFLLGMAALVGIVSSLTGYLTAADRLMPHTTTLERVARGWETKEYVTFVGTRNQDYAYEMKRDSTVTHYYWMRAGDYYFLVKGKAVPPSGSVTGLVKPLPRQLRTLVQEDARDPKIPRRLTINTTRYLDADYTPTQPTTYLFFLIFSSLAAVTLLVPPIFGYTLFSPRTGRAPLPPTAGPQWPVKVQATGRFTVEGTGKRVTEYRMPATLVRTGNPDQPLEVRYDQVTPAGLIGHVIPIPASSTVEWGYEYGGGRPLPALLFRSPSTKARVTVPTETDAHWIAEAFAAGKLGGQIP